MKQLTKKRIAAPFLALSPMLVLLAAIVAAIIVIAFIGIFTGKNEEEITAIAESGIADEICMGITAVCSFAIVKKCRGVRPRDVFHVKNFDPAVPVMLFIFMWSGAEIFDHISGIILSNFITIEPNSSSFSGIWGFICTVILAPVFEEIVFRFAGTEIPRGAYSLPLICIANGLYFSAVHGYNLQGFLHIVIFGAVMAYVFCKTRNLFYTMIAHSLNNLCCFIPLGNFAYYEKNGFVLGKWHWLAINAVLFAAAAVYYIKVFRKKYTKNYFKVNKETGLPCSEDSPQVFEQNSDMPLILMEELS
ncbi:MAG: CPBP family intramembrane metalloprotease [Oscillospiraceae bacterium]|nr:CPBP family intramembrane metalloprotease [Oscillospiraceae bacterium]